MSRAKLIYYTEIQTYIKPEVLDNLKDREESGGFPREWYEEQGLKPPKDLIETEYSLSKDDFEYGYYDAFTHQDNILDVSDLDEDEGCVITLKGGIEIRVVEDSWDIAAQFEYNALTRFERLIEKIKSKFNKE